MACVDNKGQRFQDSICSSRMNECVYSKMKMPVPQMNCQQTALQLNVGKMEAMLPVCRLTCTAPFQSSWEALWIIQILMVRRKGKISAVPVGCLVCSRFPSTESMFCSWLLLSRVFMKFVSAEDVCFLDRSWPAQGWWSSHWWNCLPQWQSSQDLGAAAWAGLGDLSRDSLARTWTTIISESASLSQAGRLLCSAKLE